MESEHTKYTKLLASIILELEGDKCSKTYFNILDRQYAKSNHSELYTDDKKIQNILAMCFVSSISLTLRYLEQKSHLSYIKRKIKKALQTIELFHHF